MEGFRPSTWAILAVLVALLFTPLFFMNDMATLMRKAAPTPTDSKPPPVYRPRQPAEPRPATDTPAPANAPSNTPANEPQAPATGPDPAE